MAIMPEVLIANDRELSLAEKVAVVTRALDSLRTARPVRALCFTRQAVGSMRELPVQRGVFGAACAARGWSAGGSVSQIGSGTRAWSAVVRMVGAGAYDVVVVDTWDRLAVTEAGQMRVLALLRRAGVRLLVAREGLDTGTQVGHDLVSSLLRDWGRVAVAR
jgi:hypothetical protein